MKRSLDFRAVVWVLLGFGSYYLLGRLLCVDKETGQQLYLYGWLLHQKWFWVSMAICLGSAMWNKRIFALLSTLGFGLGFAVGERFGEHPVDPFGNSHDGWWMWSVIFVASMVLGALIQARRGLTKPGK